MNTPTTADRFAIVAIGCRFPGGANTPEQFWKLLCDGSDAIVEIPGTRFDLAEVFDADPSQPGKLYSRWAGLADHVDTFDAEFFGISPREVVRMDPQQRLLLEVVWEALEDGGLPADQLAGSRTGVFIGISTHDYSDFQAAPVNWQWVDTYSSTGTASSIAANRISYAYDLHGPSFVVDTACSSSLTAIHLACRSLKNRECDLAIAGGVNAVLSPATSIGFCRASMLSPDGRCRAFDAGANGFVRGEGAGVVVLKPLAVAMADRDKIYAIVSGTAINQDGRTVGLMVPSANAQEALIREALRNAGVEPGAVQYVEAHGTGTRVGDPIEAAAIGRALSNGRGPANPCLIGSVKTNIGHLEAAAGIAGLIKTSLALQHRMIPASLHFSAANPAIPLEELQLRVVTALAPWPGNGARAVAGINSFGFGGANAHVVLEEAPPQESSKAVEGGDSVHILPISARHPIALRELVHRYRDVLAGAGCPSLRDLCYSAAVRSSHHWCRAAFAGANQAELVEQIDALLSRDEAELPVTARGDPEPKLAFVFTGMGPQWWGMGRQLLEKEPLFREAIEECDRVFKDIGTWSLMETLRAEESHSRVDEAYVAPTANLTIQVGLTKLWRSWGIIPDAIVGHSAGEIGAAWAAGALSLEDAFKVAFHRGRLQDRATGSGTMLAAGVAENEAVRPIEGLTELVSIAAINSPTSVTFSGKRQALEQIAAKLTEQQRFNRFLPVEVPYHAPCMEALRDEYIELLASVVPRPSAVPLLSTVSATWNQGAGVDANYWYANLRHPVRFAEAIDRLIQEECHLFIEIGPHPVLAASISECLSARSKTGRVLPSLRRKEEERRGMLRSLAGIYGYGRHVDWSGVCGSGSFVSLPHYPWQRERHWFDGEQGTPHRPSGIDSGHPLLGHRLRSVRPCWEVDLGQSRFDYLDDHIVEGSPVFPGAAYAEMALAAAKEVAPSTVAVVEAVTFHRVLFLTHRSETLLQFLYDPQSSSFEIHSGRKNATDGWTLHASGKLRTRSGDPASQALDLTAVRERCAGETPAAVAYQELQARGLHHQGMFRSMETLWRGSGEALARIARLSGNRADAKPYQVHPALLDSAFQAMLAAAQSAHGDQSNARGLYLPVSIGRLILWRDPGPEFWSHATITRFDPEAVESDIVLVNDQGEVALSIESLRCKALEARSSSTEGTLDELLYQLNWEPKPLEKRQVDEVIPIQHAAKLGVRMQTVAARLAIEGDWSDRFQRSEPLAAAIAGHLARATLITLGWDPRSPLPSDAQVLFDRLGIASRHRRFFGRLLEIAREFGGFEEAAGSAVTERLAAERLCNRMLEEFPECAAVVDLLRRCSEQLTAILTDAVDVRQVLFASEGMASWVRFFVDLPWFDFYNSLVADTISAALENIPPDNRLRILEIGAGTGGTTLPVIERLANRNVDYHFTDISTYFLTQARDRFKDRPSVQVRPLDIESDPIAQLGSKPFDVVLAANVLHATADLRATLRRVQQLLAPGGLLVLLELTSKRPWVDFIFGITEGWWRFTDFDLRPDYAILGPQEWRKVLTEAGFEGAVALSESCGEGNPFHAVMLATLPTSAGRSAEAQSSKDWLVFLDSAGIGARVAASLRKRGNRCVCVGRAEDYARRDFETVEIALDRPEQVAHLVEELAAGGFGFHGLIDASNLDGSSPTEMTASQVVNVSQASCCQVIAIVQGFEQAGRTLPPLWLLTLNAQAVGGQAKPNLTQAPLWGLGRVLANELSGAHCRLVDLGPSADESEIQALLDELELDDLEEEVAFRGPQRYVARLRRSSLPEMRRTVQVRPLSPDAHRFTLDIDTPGTLESLTLRERPGTRPGPGEVLIRVFAAGLNFRDVMLSLGMLPPMAVPGAAGKTILGFECAGVIIECGEGVERFHPGDEGMAVAMGSFASQVITRAEMVERMPGYLTFEEAATFPLVFVTAHYVLNHLARLAVGERVLIHAATGGVGLAAIQLARRSGATIFATAGTPEKRAYLKGMGIEYVMDSRSLAFADEVLAATNGEGVDVVVNSLAGEAIPKGLSILRPYGRFLELGKRDIYANAQIGLLPFDRDLSFSSVALDRMFFERPAMLGSMAREIVALVEDRELEPIPHTAFDLSKAEDALRFLAQAKHIGKIVLTVREPAYPVAPCLDRAVCSPEATYVISGGVGGFGLAIARWLLAKGAQHLVLMSRRGAPTPENQSTFDSLCQLPAEIIVFQGDVSDENDVRRMLDEIREKRPPLRGVVHAAMVLDDALLTQMTPERFRAVLLPKVAGAWNLHRLTTDDELDFFVMFSSVASVFGTRSQANYAAANAFLDALAPYRRSLGLPALTVNWGALAEVGYVSQHPEIAQHLSRQGAGLLTPAEAIEALEQALRLSVSEMALFRLDWARFSSIDEASVYVRKAKRFKDFLSVEQSTSVDGLAQRGSVLSLLSAAAPDQRQTLLETHITERVARVLGTSLQKVDPGRRLTDMGVDSLMAVELQTIVERDFGVALQLTSFLGGISIAQLTSKLLEQLNVQPVPGMTPEAVVLAVPKKDPLVRGVARSHGVGSPATPQPTPGPDGPYPSQEGIGLPSSFAHHTGYLSGLGAPPNTGEKASAVPVAADRSNQLAERTPTDPSRLEALATTAEVSEPRQLVADPATELPASGAVNPILPQPTSPIAPSGKAIDYGSIDYSRWTPLQRFLKRALSVLFRLVARLEVTGLDNIPHSGPVLIVCNHLSMMDVPLIVTILPRRAICLAADELQKLPWIRGVLDLGDTIYVRRGEADENALNQALTVLRAGGMMGVSPEGTRSRTGGLTRGHSGVAYLAAAAPAPILPVALYGQEQIPQNVKRLRRTTVHVRVGSLIHVAPGEKTAVQLRRETDRIMEAIAAMLPTAYQGVYTDALEPSESSRADATAAR